MGVDGFMRLCKGYNDGHIGYDGFDRVLSSLPKHFVMLL